MTNTITPIRQHHVVIITRQLTLLPQVSYFVTRCMNCAFTAQTIQRHQAEQLRTAHVKNPYT
jgi:hypothetical protein